MTDKSFYITTPIYYVTAEPHVGHAYTTIACDTMAIFKRLDGYDVRFTTGTDEHGLKVEQSAKKAGLDTQTFVDKITQLFVDMCDGLKTTHDSFIRTTDADHKKAAQDIWKRMEANGDIYLDKYAGWYSVSDEAYFTEDDITEDADGNKIAPTGSVCEWMEEESYFFRLSNYTDKLLKLYEEHPEFVRPDFRLNEVLGFVKQGLRDISISRTAFDWGVPIPGNDKHVMYVWVDALTNYLTAMGFPDTESEDFKKFWPCNVHMIGKDILRFHAVYWPAFLMSAGIELPKTVFAHGWWLIEGEKMSKSIGNVEPPKDLIEKYGLDQLRYALLREVTFGNDGDFNKASITARINAELANNIGNLAQRSLSMINKNCDGKIPEHGELQDVDRKLLNHAWADMVPAMRGDIEKMKFRNVIEHIIHVAHEANAYIDEQAPWTLKKTDPQRMNTVLYVLAEAIRCIGIAMQPFTPEASEKLLDQMNVAKDERDFTFISEDCAIAAGTEIPKPQGVYPRIMDEQEVAA